MRVTSFRKIILILRLVWATLRGSSGVVIKSLLFKNRPGNVFDIIHSWARSVLRIMRIKCEILNPDSFVFEEGWPYIIMSNHVSHFDIPLIYNLFPKDKVGMISKKELFKIPIFGWGMKLGGCVSIDRKNKRQAIKDLAYAKKLMLSGIRLWIAPEGTRSKTGEMGIFKKGGFKVAMETGATILPITIVGSNKILPTKTLDFSVDEEVKIHIGKPIDTKNYKKEDVKKLMADTAAAIASKL